MITHIWREQRAVFFIWMKLHRVTCNRAIYKQLVYINARIVRETYEVIISCVLAK